MPPSKAERLKMLMDNSMLSLTTEEVESEAVRRSALPTREIRRGNPVSSKAITTTSQNKSQDIEVSLAMESNAENVYSWDTPVYNTPKPAPMEAPPICSDLGIVSPRGMSFCPVQALAKFPYQFLHGQLRVDVSTRFFAAGEFYNRSWDIYYIYPPTEVSPKPLLLLPFTEVRSFFDTMSKETSTEIRLPSDPEDRGFEVDFSDMDDNHRPRHLGQSTSRSDYDALGQIVPGPGFRPEGEIAYNHPATKHTLAEFKAKIERAIDATKSKNKAQRAKKREDRFEKQRGWRRQVKRTQRYLGLRQGQQVVNPANQQEAPSSLDFSKPAPHPAEGSVVFVAIDVEWYERDSGKITEIGVSTLDAQSLVDVPLGKGGSEWMKHIQTRHFRIKENEHLINKDFVRGCADRFEFGQSEWLSLKDAPSVLADCFRLRSAMGELRNIILVGHDIGGDIEQFRKLGYNPLDVSKLVEIIDTSILYRAVKRDHQGRGLDQVLGELDIIGWNTHNAGNDAAYTLQAMIGLAVKAASEKIGADDWAKEKARRVAEATLRAKETAQDIDEGWSSVGEGSDGGIANKPSAEARGGTGKGKGRAAKFESSAGGRVSVVHGHNPAPCDLVDSGSRRDPPSANVGLRDVLVGDTAAPDYRASSDSMPDLESGGIHLSQNFGRVDIPAEQRVFIDTMAPPDEVGWGDMPAPPPVTSDTTAIKALLKGVCWGGMPTEASIDFGKVRANIPGDTHWDNMPVGPLAHFGLVVPATSGEFGHGTALSEPPLDLGLTCITTSSGLSEDNAATEPVVGLGAIGGIMSNDVDSETSPVESVAERELH